MKKRLVIPATALIAAAIIFAADQAHAQGFGRRHGQQAKHHEVGLARTSTASQPSHHLRVREAKLPGIHLEQRLEVLVADGTITLEEKQLILDKHAELRLMRQDKSNWPKLSRQDKKALRQAMHDERMSWAEENHIDLKHFYGILPHHQ